MKIEKDTLAQNELELKSTYLKINRKKVADLERLIELLNKRKDIITSSEEKLSDYQNNENAIILIKTDYELAKHHTTRIGLLAEINKYSKNASEIVDEMAEKWNEVLAKAKQEAVRKQDVAAIIKSMDEVDFEENIDVKINYYLHLKGVVYNNLPKQPLKKV